MQGSVLWKWSAQKLCSRMKRVCSAVRGLFSFARTSPAMRKVGLVLGSLGNLSTLNGSMLLISTFKWPNPVVRPQLVRAPAGVERIRSINH